ncbi:MAG: hypothetical protein ABIP53_10920, partial [Candidatus Limnocylindrales bacterium]
ASGHFKNAPNIAVATGTSANQEGKYQGKLYIDYLDSMDELINVAQMADEVGAEEQELAPLA